MKTMQLRPVKEVGMKKAIYLILPICSLIFTTMISESSAEIFATEYNQCIQKCMPKEKCCTETCGYKACIKQNITRETAVGAELTDRGAADAAMAVCYPHLGVMKKCFNQNKIKELDSIRGEYCALAVAKTKTYTSKETCISSLVISEKRSGKSTTDLVKTYEAGIAAFKK